MPHTWIIVTHTHVLKTNRQHDHQQYHTLSFPPKTSAFSHMNPTRKCHANIPIHIHINKIGPRSYLFVYLCILNISPPGSSVQKKKKVQKSKREMQLSSGGRSNTLLMQNCSPFRGALLSTVWELFFCCLVGSSSFISAPKHFARIVLLDLRTWLVVVGTLKNF